MKTIALSFLILLISSMPAQAAFDNTHKQWNDLLKQYVHWNAKATSTSVNYEGFIKDRVKLNAYLKTLSSLSRQEYAKWPLAEQQAFLINAYNAYTIDLVLTRYPELTSIKDFGGVFSSPWKQNFFILLGEKRSLDDVGCQFVKVACVHAGCTPGHQSGGGQRQQRDFVLIFHRDFPAA